MRFFLPILSAALLTACEPVPVTPGAIDADAQPRSLGNWADQDTHGVGTHELVDASVKLLDADGMALTGVTEGEQMVLTGSSMESSSGTVQQAILKGGKLDGTEVWAPESALSFTTLEVCGSNQVPIRTLGDLSGVQQYAKSGDLLFVTDAVIRNTGQHRYFRGSINGTDGYVPTDWLCPESTEEPAPSDPAPGGKGTDAEIVLDNHFQGTTTLWNQTFGRQDGASPLENITDAAAGRPAKTSCYGGAPCNEVFLSANMLSAMVSLVDDYGYKTFVTSIAGAAHSAGSYHYQGRAFDIDEINGQRIYGDSPAARSFMQACWNLGAVEVFGPSNDPSGHYDHIHCAF